MTAKHIYPFVRGAWIDENPDIPLLPPLVEAAAERYLNGPTLSNFEILLLAVHDAASDALPYPNLPAEGWLSPRRLLHFTLFSIWLQDRYEQEFEQRVRQFVKGRISAAMRRLRKEALIVEEQVTLVDVSAIEIFMDPDRFVTLGKDLPLHKREELEAFDQSIRDLGPERFSPENCEVRERRFKYVETVSILTPKGKKELIKALKTRGKEGRKEDSEDTTAKSLDPRVAKATPMTCAEFGERFGRDASWAYRQFKQGAGFKPMKGSKAIFWFEDWIEALERRSRTL